MKNELSNPILDSFTAFELRAKRKENIDRGERIIFLLAGSWLLYQSLKKIDKHPFFGLQAITYTWI